MTDFNIGIVLGTIRQGRSGEGVARWVLDQAKQRGDAAYELVDLADYDLPLLTSPTVPGAANRAYDDERTTRWGQKIDSLDGFVFVTPEYNHGLPGAFKNAVDSIYPEWGGKAVGFVGYGADGGVRAVEQWRAVVANLHLHDVRGQVSLSLFDDFGDNGFAPQERRVAELSGVLDQVIGLTNSLRG